MHQDIEKLLNAAKKKGRITECDKSRLLTMAEKQGVSKIEINKLLKSIPVKASPTAKFNKDLYPELVTYDEAMKWVKTQKQPVEISTYGEESPFPFKLQVDRDDLLLTGNNQTEHPSKYLLTREKWDQFCNYVKEHPNMCRGELSENYKDYGCNDSNYWPSIISISKACK